MTMLQGSFDITNLFKQINDRLDKQTAHIEKLEQSQKELLYRVKEYGLENEFNQMVDLEYT